jgi:hypothetical protein
MNPDDIKLENINKMLVYEQQSRIIEQLDREELIKFAKSYFKLYLKQQEVLSKI